MSAQQQAAQCIPCVMPTRHAPASPGRHACPMNSNGERQCLKHACLSGDNWNSPAEISAMPAAKGTTRLTRTEAIAAREIHKPAANPTVPNSTQTAKYPAPTISRPSGTHFSPVETATRRYSANIGHVEGSIIATIIASHISRNIHAADHGVSPGIVIHIMGIDQPPGIGMLPPI